MKDAQVRSEAHSAHNFVFWFHVFITILAWAGPFLFSWYLMLAAYLTVVLQFAVFNKCLLNAEHDLSDEDHTTFYSYLLEKMGMTVNRKRLKHFVRRYLYILLGILTLVWQLLLKFEPLLF